MTNSIFSQATAFLPYINAALGEATREAARHDTRSRRKQLVRVNELASERAGESEPAIMTMYYILYVGVKEQKKRKQTEYVGIPFFKNHLNDFKIKLFFHIYRFFFTYLYRITC